MIDPRVTTMFVAALDPSLLPAVPVGALGSPAMTTERELFTVLTSGSGITADVLQGVTQTDNIEANSLATVAFNYGFNEAQWDRVRAYGDAADAVATGIAGRLVALTRNTAFNGATYDRLRTASATNQALTSGLGALRVADVGNWAQHSEPAVNTVATTTRAAGGAGVRHICTGINATLNAVIAIAAPISLYLRDGAAGVGAILQSWRFIVPIGETGKVELSGLKIVGSANTAMTLEWGAVPGAGNFENVALTGYSTA